MTVTVESVTVATGTVRAAGARTPRATAPVRPSTRRRPVTTTRSRVTAGAPSCVTAAPQPIAASSAVQLTRRGWVLLVGVATAVAAVLVWVAFLSHPATSSPVAAAAPAQVVVQSGDTLWSIAERIAPGSDPRAVVYDLQQANHLAGVTVVEGQVLRTS